MPKGIFYLILSLLTFGLTAIGPWWFSSLIPFLLSMYCRFGAWRGFLVGFLLNLIIWAMLILSRDAGNQGILSERIAGVFGMSKTLLLLFNHLVGGLLGGVGGASGAQLAGAFLVNRRKVSENP